MGIRVHVGTQSLRVQASQSTIETRGADSQSRRCRSETEITSWGLQGMEPLRLEKYVKSDHHRGLGEVKPQHTGDADLVQGSRLKALWSKAPVTRLKGGCVSC